VIEVLDHSEVARDLLGRGLVEARDIVEAAFDVADVSRRNRVFVATTATAAYVVKQAVDASEALAHEAAVLQALATAPAIADCVPHVVDSDPRAGLLILRTPPGGLAWDDEARVARSRARKLGRILGTLHGLKLDLPASGHDAMWGLSLPAPPREFLLTLSIGAQEVVARVQASAALCARLEALRDRCGHDRPIHGDVRWENCLTLAAPGAGRRTRVLLVDWELGGPGEPAFDVAGVISEYLRTWVGSIPMVDPRDPARLLGRARVPLQRVQPAIRAFWQAYRDALPTGAALRLVVELTAVRLLQTAVERAQRLVAPSAHVMALVQLAANLLSDPDKAAKRLLGLGK
jgi:aminoglycoside phosphotransferase (APT) family kinase protein